MKQVSTSILSKTDKFINVNILNNTNTDYIHIDVMDGNFVNNVFITKEELLSLIKLSTKKLDIHLMVNNPKEYVSILENNNIGYVTIHYEIDNFYSNLMYIKNLGFKVGVAIKPETKIDVLYDYLDIIDLVLIMGVNPGYSGQEFIPFVEDKINNLRCYINKNNKNVKISVDGGVCESVLAKIKNVDIIVSASYILNNLNNIDKIKAS